MGNRSLHYSITTNKKRIAEAVFDEGHDVSELEKEYVSIITIGNDDYGLVLHPVTYGFLNRFESVYCDATGAMKGRLPLDDTRTLFRLSQENSLHRIPILPHETGLHSFICRFRPKNFSDLVTATAVGSCMVPGIKESVLQQREERTKGEFTTHTLLTEILQETYGAMLYEEQAVNIIRPVHPSLMKRGSVSSERFVESRQRIQSPTGNVFSKKLRRGLTPRKSNTPLSRLKI